MPEENKKFTENFTENRTKSEKSGRKIVIYIPARNAAKTILKVLERIPPEVKDRVKEIFVVDNASKDNTSLLVLEYKKSKNLPHLKVMHNAQDQGYGGSQKMAYKYAIENGFDVIAMLHGDAQYAPEYLSYLLKPVENNEADLMFGSRMTGDPKKGGMPFWKRLGNRSLTRIENHILETNLSEFHSGYRVYSVEALKKMPLERCSNDYRFDSEILVLFALLHLRIRERSIPTYYSSDSKSPSLYDLSIYAFNILSIMSRYFLHKKGWRKDSLFSRAESKDKNNLATVNGEPALSEKK